MNIVIASILVLGITGFLFGVLLSILSKKLAVKEDERVKKVLDVLPGINCGACGFSGCRAFAEAVVKNNNIFSGCIPGGDAVNQKIKDTLGLNISLESTKKRVAVCHCGANSKEKKSSTDYLGPLTCRAADIAGASIDCAYGCLGFGDCEKVCPVKAIEVKERKVYINVDICIGCGMCVEACPRGLIELVDFDKDKPLYYVACSNKDKGAETRKVCSRGCIACSICAKVDGSPFVIENNLSRIDRTKETSSRVLKKASDKCPAKCIVRADDERNR